MELILFILSAVFGLTGIICGIVLIYGSRQLDKEMQKGIEMENKIREEMLKHVQEENEEE